MGAASKIALVSLRFLELAGSVIVLGILARFVDLMRDAHGWKDGRVIYGLVVASISTLFSLVFMLPFLYTIYGFPGDIMLFVLWLVRFCLLIAVSPS